jgi:hypothetical protein
MTITLNRRTVAGSALLAAVALLLAFAAYSYGESTRMSDAQVDHQVSTTVEKAVAARGAKAASDQTAAVTATTKSVRRTTQKADRKVWMKRLKKHEDAAHAAGYSTGSAAGYSSGNADGYSSGHESGVEDGIDTASDELTCSDDMDVALPMCN